MDTWQAPWRRSCSTRHSARSRAPTPAGPGTAVPPRGTVRQIRRQLQLLQTLQILRRQDTRPHPPALPGMYTTPIGVFPSAAAPADPAGRRRGSPFPGPRRPAPVRSRPREKGAAWGPASSQLAPAQLGVGILKTCGALRLQQGVFLAGPAEIFRQVLYVHLQNFHGLEQLGRELELLPQFGF